MKTGRVALLFCAAVLTALQARAQGTISGCAVDDAGLSLPGVTITVTGPGGRHTAVTDPRGCYRVPGVAAGRYTVTAVLAAFRSITLEGISAAEGQTSVVDLEMSPTGIVEIDWLTPPGGLAGLWNEADAVVRARIERSVQPDGRRFTEHAAAIAEVFKWPALLQRGPEIVFRQERWFSEPAAYTVGQDLIVFLSLRRGIFYRTAGWLGAFLVDGNRIRGMHPDVAKGVTTADLLGKLRALAGG